MGEQDKFTLNRKRAAMAKRGFTPWWDMGPEWKPKPKKKPKKPIKRKRGPTL